MTVEEPPFHGLTAEELPPEQLPADAAPPPVLHPDFAELAGTVPGAFLPEHSGFAESTELFSIVNLICFGGAVDRLTHVPAELGRAGPVALWESTGAADHLPFWNTNYDGDAWLYLVHGSVRVEFKQTGGSRRLGHYLARTGDLFRLPPGVAHRTFSGDGQRRITLEVLPHNPFWDLPDPAMPSSEEVFTAGNAVGAGGFRFEPSGSQVLVTAAGRAVRAPRSEFARGLRALVAHRLHLGHNEFDGGFSIHDHGDHVVLAVPGHSEELPAGLVLAAFSTLLAGLAH